jgi:hypothetical protein
MVAGKLCRMTLGALALVLLFSQVAAADLTGSAKMMVTMWGNSETGVVNSFKRVMSDGTEPTFALAKNQALVVARVQFEITVAEPTNMAYVVLTPAAGGGVFHRTNIGNITNQNGGMIRSIDSLAYGAGIPIAVPFVAKVINFDGSVVPCNFKIRVNGALMKK